MNTSASKPVESGADISPATAALEKAYRAIARRYPDCPPATIVIKRDAKAWGHTTVAHTWAPAGQARPDRLEIMISGENLARGARHVAATLIHEAAHARNLARGIIDCDVNQRHNRKFATAAEEMGLTVTEKGWHGWAVTELSDEGAEQWAAVIALIERGLTKAAAAPKPVAVQVAKPGTVIAVPGAGGTWLTVPPKRGNRNLLKAVCGCGHSIRASKGVLDNAGPVCSQCDQQFTAA